MGLGKIYTALLWVIALSITIMISQSPNYKDMADITYKPCLISTSVTEHLDLAAATGNVISHQCQKTLLVMAGVEQNPGPETEMDPWEQTVKKQEDILADLCFKTQDGEVRECLRQYKVQDTMYQIKQNWQKWIKQY